MNFLFVDYENGMFCEFSAYHYSKNNLDTNDKFVGCVTRRKGNLPIITKELVDWADIIIVTTDFFKKSLLFSFPTNDDKISQALYTKIYSINTAEYKGSHYDNARETWESNVITKVDSVIKKVKDNLLTN